MKGIFNKEFRSKLELKNKRIYEYIYNDSLEIEKVMNDYTKYICTIISNHTYNFSKEDEEEIVLDVFLTLWRNRYKLNKNNYISSYIGGITRNLIKLKFRDIKITDNIEEYDEKLIELSNIEFVLTNNEKSIIIMEELNRMKTEDKNLFISYYNDELKIKQLSKIYNMSESKIKSKLFRIRKRLNKKLKERGYGMNG